MEYINKISNNNKINNKINKIINKFIKLGNYNLYFLILIDLIKKELKKKIKQNIELNSDECIICLNIKKFFFKSNCCNNPKVCIDCFGIMLNLKKINCVICRKDILTEYYISINKTVDLLIYNNKKINKKYIKKKKKIIKQLNYKKSKDNIINQIKRNNEYSFNLYGFYFDNMTYIEILDFYFYKITWNINNRISYTNVNIKNNIVYLGYKNNIYVELHKFI